MFGIPTKKSAMPGVYSRSKAMISIREEKNDDQQGIRAVNEQAFSQPREADIVDKLRKTCPHLLSLVALDENRIVGHILFSPVTIEGKFGIIQGMGLAPMAVIPAYQRQGIGSDLVRTGIAMLRKRACPFVIVLGHPGYYPRFGFEPASRRNIRCQWEGVPDKAFMILVLDDLAMAGVSGTAEYRGEFDGA